MQEHSGETLAYLAGLVDADGWISLQGAGKRVNLNVILGVANTDVGLLRWLRETFGGHIDAVTKENRRHRALGRWTLRGQHAVELLAFLQPRLRIKSRQAWLAREFWAQRAPFKMGRARLPMETIALRLGYHAAMHELNRTGPVKGRLSIDAIVFAEREQHRQGELAFRG